MGVDGGGGLAAAAPSGEGLLDSDLICSLHWTLAGCSIHYVQDSHRPLGYERVYLPLHRVADIPFQILR